MADVFATKTGNWTDTTVWSTSSLPTSADAVFANGFTVTINTSPHVLEINTLRGGGFSITSNNRSLTGNVIAGTSTCLTCNAGAGNNTFIYGNVYGSRVAGTGFLGISQTSGRLNLFGNSYGGYFNNNSGISSYGNTLVTNIVGNLYGGIGQRTCGIEGTSILSVTGYVYGGLLGGGDTSGNYGIFRYAQTGSPIYISGGVIGGYTNETAGIYMFQSPNNPIRVEGFVQGGYIGSTNAFNSSHGIYDRTHGLSAWVDVAIGGRGGGDGIYLDKGLSFVYIGTAKGGDFGAGSTEYYGGGVAVRNTITTSAVNVFVNSIECGKLGQFPTAGIVYFSGGTASKGVFQDGSGGSVTVFLPGSATLYTPISSNVRLGTVYDQGKSIGSLAMPIPSQVNFSVPLDNTLGTAVFDSNTVFAVTASQIRTSGSIGERISRVATTSGTRSLINNIS